MSRTAFVVAFMFSVLLVLSYTAVDQEFYNISPIQPGPDLAPGLVPGMYLWGSLNVDSPSIGNTSTFTGYELALAPHAPLNGSMDFDAPEALRGTLKRISQEVRDPYTGVAPGDEACDLEMLPDFTGSIALVKRGKCSIFTKLMNCQLKGAKAVVLSGSDLPLISLDAVHVPAMIVSQADFQALSTLDGEEATMWTLPPDLDLSLVRLALLLFVRPLIMLSILLVILVGNINTQSKRRRSPPEVVSRLPVHHWEAQHPNEWLQTQCSICLEDFEENNEIMALPCGHEFHRACVAQWLILRRGVCPLCWREVPNERTPLLA